MSQLSWGRYPKYTASNIFNFNNIEDCLRIIKENNNLIACGNGRSYGDSALGINIINVKAHNYFISFDDNTGLLHVQSGVLLSEILDVFVPRGWFFKITPGTKFVTIGGAIAADVHGKNHHIEGCFSTCVKEFQIMLRDGKIVTCSKSKTPELFRATCGGMGLTGIILDAKIYLKKINSQYIEQTTIKTKNLQETFEFFEIYKDTQYSVAWVDCLAKNEDIGRSLLMVGDFSNDGKFDYENKNQISIPFNFPRFTLNHLSVKFFNWFYYNRVQEQISKQKVNIDSFFYPLDIIGNWNRIYGKNGFTQYQFILPKATSYKGLKEILKVISDSGQGSFLAVLKLYGNANDNYLSFPMEGYSLALDFKMQQNLFALLDKLDEVVIRYGGRIYLAKDVRVSKQNFEQHYSQIENFRKYRKENDMSTKFQSLQSERLET